MCNTQKSSPRRVITIVVLGLLGAALNVAICIFFKLIGFPLYLDTIMTIAVTLTGGLFAGILCGALTNIIIHSIYFWGWEVYLFSLCSIATAVAVWLFARFFPRELNMDHAEAARENLPATRNVMDLVIVLILLSFTLCIIISILGGIIATLITAINQPLVERASLAGILAATMFNQEFPLLLKEILSRIPINSIDRLISAFAGFGFALCIRQLIKSTLRKSLTETAPL